MTHCPYCGATKSHICKAAERSRQIFEELLKKHGAIILEEKLRRLESYRTYYRRWPFDGKVAPQSIEYVEDWLPGEGPDPREQMIFDQSRTEYLGRLTAKELEVAKDLEQGLKPRDIARKQGKKNSGSIRYLKHSIKMKFKKEETR